MTDVPSNAKEDDRKKDIDRVASAAENAREEEHEKIEAELQKMNGDIKNLLKKMDCYLESPESQTAVQQIKEEYGRASEQFKVALASFAKWRADEYGQDQ